MCIAIAKQTGFVLTEATLRNCFDNNPDGAGFCVEVDGKLIINKGYFTFEDFYTAYQPYENEKALLHFRIRTHGDVDTNNCHPFVVSDDVAFVHNGIIPNVIAHGKESDTIVFNQQYLQPIVAKYGPNALTSPALKNLIEHFIGPSKLAVFVKGQKDFIFFNENLGNRSAEDIWFSNLSWQHSKPTVFPVSNYRPVNNYKNWKEQKDLVCDFEKEKSSLPPFPQQKRKEVDYLKLANGNIFCFGTIVEVTWPINGENFTIPKGAYGEIDRVYNDKTVDIDFYLEGKIENLHVSALQIVKNLSQVSDTFL